MANFKPVVARRLGRKECCHYILYAAYSKGHNSVIKHFTLNMLINNSSVLINETSNVFFFNSSKELLRNDTGKNSGTFQGP